MPIPTLTAREYFEYIGAQADPYHFLESIADPSGPHYPFFEQEWIDFKGMPRDEKDLKKTWSKALSGYANITDGLIVWGIDAQNPAAGDRRRQRSQADFRTGCIRIEAPRPYSRRDESACDGGGV